jgi:hypothetical protein
VTLGVTAAGGTLLSIAGTAVAELMASDPIPLGAAWFSARDGAAPGCEEMHEHRLRATNAGNGSRPTRLLALGRPGRVIGV